MKISYEIIKNEHLVDNHRRDFGDLLKIQNKVTGDVYLKADRCKLICIVKVNEAVVSIGGIKPKTSSDFSNEKADLSEFSNLFEWELGYLFTKKEFEGRGLATNVVRLLLQEYGEGNLMASTEISKNPGMVKILERHDFRHYGKPWKSEIHANFLGLFLKFS